MTRAPRTAISIAPLPAAFLSRVRAEGVDDLGQSVRHLVAKGGEPCRDVLRRATPGQALILASFTPFQRAGPYREYGPVFVLADGGTEQPPLDVLPPAGQEDDYLRRQFVVRAYSGEEEILDARMVQAPRFALAVDLFFASEDVAFLHVRFPTYGCFACRIDRRG